MAFGFSQVTDVCNKAKCFAKIAKAEGPLDAWPSSRNSQFGVCDRKPLRFLMRERRDATAARGAFLLGKSLGHVLVFPCSLEAKGDSGSSQRCRTRLFNLIPGFGVLLTKLRRDAQGHHQGSRGSEPGK